MRSESELAARRRMRKGTKSCLPCRSRKIRCTYPPNSSTCNACLAQGRECAEQTYQDVKNGGLDKRVGLKQRVRELETLVQQLVEKGGADARAIESNLRGQVDLLSPPDSTAGRSRSDESSPPGLSRELTFDENSSDEYDSLDDVEAMASGGSKLQTAPLMALFDNSLLLRDDTTDVQTPAQGASPGAYTIGRQGTSSKARQTRQAEELRSLFPPWESIKAILDSGCGLLSMWREHMVSNSFFGISNIDEGMKQLSESNNPNELCKGLILLTLILQQIPENASLSNPAILTGKRQALFIQKSIETVDNHLCTGNSIIGTIDGLECAVLLCRILLNAGRPRKAWLLNQRALAYARLLGLHRSTSWHTDRESLGIRRQQIWWQIFISDRSFSLLLGLPYSVADSHVGIDPNGSTDPVGISKDLMPKFYHFLRLSIINGRIIDRNYRSGDLASTYSETMKIDGELHALEMGMPKIWLELGAEDGNIDEFMKLQISEIFEAANTQIWHHSCRIALHMPFMMMNAEGGQGAGQYEYSRMIALRSARSLIRAHLRFRQRSELSNIVCQIIDFQIFMAAVLLILDLLATNKATGMPRVLGRDAESVQDELLTRDAYKILRQLAQHNMFKTNIPAQSIKVLETLAYVIHGNKVSGTQPINRRIVIPYFGAITIKPSSTLQRHQKNVQEHIAANGCRCPSECEEFSTTNVKPPSIPTPQSFSSLDDQSTSQANEFSFNSFVAPQHSMSLNPQTNSLDSMFPNPDSQGYDNLMSNFAAPQGMELDPQMWSTELWENMLDQDATLDLDVNWGYIPMEGTTMGGPVAMV